MTGFGKYGIFSQYRWIISRIQQVLDGAVVVLLLAFLCRVYSVSFDLDFLLLGGITSILTIGVFRGANLYRPWRGANLTYLVRRVFSCWILIAAMLTMAGYITKTSYYFSRAVVMSWMVLVPVALVGLRLTVYLGLHWFRAGGRNSRTVVIAGAGHLGRRLAKNVVETTWLGMRLFGFFDDGMVGEKVAILPGNNGYPVLGDLDAMVEFVRDHKIDMVYLALPLRAEERLREVVDALQDTTASVYFVPDVFTFSLLQATFSDLRGIPLISLWETPFFGINAWIKRVEDIILSSIILVCILPVMLIIALGVKLSSPGPIIFKQRRYGLDGHEILVYKFRTMRACEDGPEITQATQNDHRVTPFGSFLRRTSLDELPQFINVLQGSMSIVGPRPHAVAHNEFYRNRIPGYMLRHKVRPGITGWAQINGWRGETEALEKMEKRVEYDLEYLSTWTLWLDLKIIFRTIFCFLSDSRAY